MDASMLKKLASLIRYFILISSSAAGSGHPTSSLSATDLMTVLFFRYLQYDLGDPKHPANDRVLFSKGHASPLFYGLYAAAGKITEKELLGYRTFDSVLEGHPSMRFPYTEVPTGSLGQGLAVGVGQALSVTPTTPTLDSGNQSVKLHQVPRVYVLCGDGELAEGSVWEAASWAGHAKLDNLIAIVDINRLGQSADTMFGQNLELYKKRFEAFGWHTVVVQDGNNIAQVDEGFAKAMKNKGKPTVILAKTKKGSGISFLENKNGWHGKALAKNELALALKELGSIDKKIVGEVRKPKAVGVLPQRKAFDNAAQALVYEKGVMVATRRAFGTALSRLGARYPDLIVLDGDVKNSTYTEDFEKAFPDRFLQMYIAEQLMAGVSAGLAARGKRVVAATFAAFWSRAHDQIRMLGMSGLPVVLCGSHAGVSIGEDGPSQMALEDLAMFRSIPGSVVVYPSDAVSTDRITEELIKRGSGVSYIRTSRPATPVLYASDEQFSIGGSKIFPASPSSRTVVTVFAAGITVHEALKAQKILEGDGVGVRVVDCYSVKPIDHAAITKAARDCAGIIIVEDHYPEGGLGEAVMAALIPLKVRPLKVVHLAVSTLPRSGKPSELLAWEAIDSAAIVKTAMELAGKA